MLNIEKLKTILDIWYKTNKLITLREFLKPLNLRQEEIDYIEEIIYSENMGIAFSILGK